MPQPLAKPGLSGRLIWYLPGTFWVLFIFYLSVLIPGSNFPVCMILGFIPLDKLGHFTCYGFLIFCYMPALQKQYHKGKSRFVAEIVLITLAIGYGVAIEFIQRLPIVNRTFEVGDMIADAVGCFLGYLGYKIVVLWIKAAETPWT